MNLYKKTLKIVSLFIAIFVLNISIEAATVKNKNYSKVVQELSNLYETNDDFKELLNNSLSSAIPTPDGWSVDPNNPNKLYKWPDKNITNLLDFFEDWLIFTPNTTNGMQYYELLYGLCYKNVNAIKFVSTEPGLSWTRKYVEARGTYMDSKESINDNIGAMTDWYTSMGPKLWNEFKAPHPTNEGFKGYKTFNEFFTRELSDSTVRPISNPDNPTILVSPADGLSNVINSNLNTNSKIHTKYDEYLNVSQLLAGSKYAKYFNGGTATATVLLPDDYHHYHSPVKGEVVESNSIDSDGVFFGMDGEFFTFSNNGNIGGYKSNYGVFGVYHRGYYIIKTENFGYVAMIPIGLDDISSINFESKFKSISESDSNVSVEKGEIVGHFAYGGSTVILLFEAGIFDGIKLNQGTQLGKLNTK